VTTHRAAPDRFLLGVVVGAVLLMAAGVGAVALVGSRPPAVAPDPSSPVGVVRAYVEATRGGDTPRAKEYLSQSAREELDRARDGLRGGYVETAPDREQRVLIEPLSEGAERAEVKVTVSTFTARSDPFSTGTWHREVVVRLVREGGAWRVSQPSDPYVFAY
jgi:hypothetical protein